jgi:membrane-associated phospholipid phosphatase
LLDDWEQPEGFVMKRLQTIWHHRIMLALLLLGVLLPLYGFGQLAEEIWEREDGFPGDVPLLLWIHAHAQLTLDFWASRLTRLGGFWGVTYLSMLVALILGLRRQWRSLTYFIVTMLGNGLINRVAKAALHRVRPHLWTSPAPEYDYGFPSGHAMGSMALVAALVILTWQTRWLWWVLGVGSLYILMIGWTRLYLGVHYPSDITAGWLAAMAWAVGVRFLIPPSTQPEQSHPIPHQQ